MYALGESVSGDLNRILELLDRRTFLLFVYRALGDHAFTSSFCRHFSAFGPSASARLLSPRHTVVVFLRFLALSHSVVRFDFFLKLERNLSLTFGFAAGLARV